VFARLRTFTQHPTSAVAGVKLALRDYTASQSGARDLISTVWNTLDCNLDATASIINLVVDFLEEEEKKTDLLNAWNSFKNERRRDLPPDLITLPTTTGTDYARIANGRAVSAASAHRAAPPRQTQRAVWDRVAQAAERGATFPPLRAPPRQQQQQPRSHSATPLQVPQSPNTGPTPGVRKRGVRKTAWSASATSVGGGGSNSSDNTNAVSKTSQGGKPPPAPPPPAPSLTNAAFPILPSSVAPRAPPVVSARTGQLQHILGSMPPATSAWAPGRAAQDEAVGEGEVEAAVPEEAVAGGKKRGKQKQKQTLLVFGSYPITGTGRQD
jgi:E3 ubiquitin-protein ligase ZNF598